MRGGDPAGVWVISSPVNPIKFALLCVRLDADGCAGVCVCWVHATLF